MSCNTYYGLDTELPLYMCVCVMHVCLSIRKNPMAFAIIDIRVKGLETNEIRRRSRVSNLSKTQDIIE